MPFNTSLSWVPNLADAVEYHPLQVQPETPLVHAIALINQAHQGTCLLPDVSDQEVEHKGGNEPESKDSEEDFSIHKRVPRASCVLVTHEQKLLGILTERDVVRLTALSTNLQVLTVADVMVHPVITLPEQALQDIFAALFLFRRYRIRHLPIVNADEQLVGVISHESIRHVLRPANLLRFRRVSDVMATDIVHASLATSVLQLAQLMTTHRVSCVVITQTDSEDERIDRPVGIVTERDIVQFQALQIDLNHTEAHTVMSSPLFLLSPEDSLWTAHQEMQKRRVGRLVVSWNWGCGLGIVTQTSLLRVFDPMEMYGVIENLQQTIQQMEAKQDPETIRNLEPQANIQSSHLKDLKSPSNQHKRVTQVANCTIGQQDMLPLMDAVYMDMQSALDYVDHSDDQVRLNLESALERFKQLFRLVKER